jgi:hypothetical protein
LTSDPVRERVPELQFVGLQEARGARCFKRMVAGMEPGLDPASVRSRNPGGSAAKNSRNATARVSGAVGVAQGLGDGGAVVAPRGKIGQEGERGRAARVQGACG